VAWICGFFIVSVLGNKYGWSKKLTGCLILTAGLGNTSFLGFLLLKQYCQEGMKQPVDQLGTFVVLSTLDFSGYHVFKRGPNGIQIFKKIMLFPFITFIVACLMNVFNFDFHEWTVYSAKVGSGVTPLALNLWAAVAF
jgi:predicted permease